MPAAPDFAPAPDFVRPKRALISLSDKSGLIEAARLMTDTGIEIISTGGTRAVLMAAGLEITNVEAVTGYPEMMDGRVKTLHPNIHGAILAHRDAPEHAKALEAHAITPIDIVWIDLYPFESTIASNAPLAEAIENIDIGGPAMIRSAAKNHAYVAVCTDRAAMDAVLATIKTQGGTDISLRRSLAARAFARTATYDGVVANYFAEVVGEVYPQNKLIIAKRHMDLRYGENPHQSATFYKTNDNRPGVTSAHLIQGKGLSYNNIADTDAALELVAEFAQPACVIVKHANPCGAATGLDALDAYTRALACDPVSAFGGIVALNRRLDRLTAEKIVQTFTEVVIAPAIDEEALKVFAAKKNLRLLISDMPDPCQGGEVYRSVSGGLLVQSRDTTRLTASDLTIVTQRQPSASEIEDMLFAFTVAKHVKSNAIVYAKGGQTQGIGAGQMNRRDSAKIAAMRALEAATALGLNDSLAKGSACASEAFFPFADGLLEAAAAGATAIIQPGGSIKDDEVIKAADAAGLTMAFTGVRVFKH
jgi:phosphoribosylaminoimidazolecarboxamide formyltransferase / IMP cyclohydrolase